MDKINPLTEEQIAELNSEYGKIEKHSNDMKEWVFRFMANGQAVDVMTGDCSKKGSNIIYHKHYFGMLLSTAKLIAMFLRNNNPGIKIKYEKGE